MGCCARNKTDSHQNFSHVGIAINLPDVFSPLTHIFPNIAGKALTICSPFEKKKKKNKQKKKKKKKNKNKKNAYSNLLKISPPKTESFQIKKNDIFHISARNIDCGYSLEPPQRGGSNENPQSMF